MKLLITSVEGIKKADALNAISKLYWTQHYDSSVLYANKALGIANKLHYAAGEAEAFRNLGVTSMYKGLPISEVKPLLDKAMLLFKVQGNKKGMADVFNNLGYMSNNFRNYPDALLFFDSSLALFRQIGFKKGEAAVLNYTGIVYQQMGEFQKAIDYTLKGTEIRKTTDDYGGTVFSLINTGNMFLNGGQPDIAMKYYRESIEYAQHYGMDAFPFSLDQVGSTFMRLKQYDSAKVYLLRPGVENVLLKAQFFFETGKADSAKKYLEKILAGSQRTGDQGQIAASLNWMSKIAYQQQQFKLAMQYARQAFTIADTAQLKTLRAEAAAILSQLNENSGNYKSSLYYFKLAHSILDSVASGNYQNKLANFESKTAIEKGQADIKILSAQKALQQQRLSQERLYKNSILLSALIAILIAFFIIRNTTSQKIKIQIQKDKIDFQKTLVEASLEELTSTQAQLIHREKMASLGELTAGIAHEIQNPLNFVNNFSDVNTELLDELNAVAANGNIVEVSAIIKEIKDNEQKINHHGKRADAIVKGMLQHSRTSTGKKEFTNINTLAEEYLRLSYQGLRAKDQNFNATINTQFDDAIGLVYIVPQDIGRVLLNLYNNAFYACTESSRSEATERSRSEATERSRSALPPEVGFKDPSDKNEPTVWVSTKKKGNNVLILVKDNGPGIPQKNLDKIFQPFFTTKPTGQGTGLGLSLSYDIINAHGGEIKVETKEGEGTTFIISLPIA